MRDWPPDDDSGQESTETVLSDHSEVRYRTLSVLEDFVDVVGERQATAHLKGVVSDGKYLKGKHLGQAPERFIEEHLIFPLLETLGHEIRPQPVQYAPRWPSGGRPDFAVTTLPPAKAKDRGIRVFGEAKPINKIHYARDDVAEYLAGDQDFDAVVFLCDGLTLECWVRHRNEPIDDDDDPAARAELGRALERVQRRNFQHEEYSAHQARSRIPEAELSKFNADGLWSLLEDEFGNSFGSV
jgi:hypothetical protein